MGKQNRAKTGSDTRARQTGTMHWSKIQSDYNKTPGSRGGHTLTLDSTETRIIMFGGQAPGPDECFLYLNDLHVFDVETLEWFSPRVTGKLPPARAFHSAFCIETRFFVFGGSGPKGAKFNDVWCLNLETSVWSKSQVAGKPPCARFWQSSSVHNNTLVVSCGQDGANDLADVHLLVVDGDDLYWEKGANPGPDNLPSARAMAACACVDGAVFIHGGMKQEDGRLGAFRYLNELHIYDSENKEFIRPRVTGMWPTARAYHRMTLVGDKLVMFGGWAGEKEKLGSELVSYLETRQMSWESAQATGEAPIGQLYGYDCVAVGASIVVFGGWDGRNAGNQTYILDCASLFQ